MPKLTIKINRIIKSEQVLNTFIQVVRPNLPLDLQHTRITAEDILYNLGYADVNRLSIASTCQVLNRIFHQQLHPSLLKGQRDDNIAIDLTRIPYHGQPYEAKKEIVRAAPKSGTTHFHGYATVSIVHDDRRGVVELRFVEYADEPADIFRWLIKWVKSLKIRFRRVFLDKEGCCSKPVFKVLGQHKLSYGVPIPVRGKSGGVRRLF